MLLIVSLVISDVKTLAKSFFPSRLQILYLIYIRQYVDVILRFVENKILRFNIRVTRKIRRTSIIDRTVSLKTINVD